MRFPLHTNQDGGEPAKAWQAYRKAIASGDFGAIRKVIAAENVKDTQDPDSVDGHTATLLVQNLDEKNSKGTVTLRREKGQWKTPSA